MFFVGRVSTQLMDEGEGKGADPQRQACSCLPHAASRVVNLLRDVSALYSTCLKNRQRHSQWVHLLLKQPKRLSMPPDVSIPSACRLRHHPTPRLQPLLQQANQQLQVQPSILNRRLAIYVTNVSFVLLFLF